MIQFLTLMLSARRDEEKGATAVEYGLMVALIAAVIIIAVGAIGTNLTELFTGVSEDLVPAGGE